MGNFHSRDLNCEFASLIVIQKMENMKIVKGMNLLARISLYLNLKIDFMRNSLSK